MASGTEQLQRRDIKESLEPADRGSFGADRVPHNDTFATIRWKDDVVTDMVGRPLEIPAPEKPSVGKPHRKRFKRTRSAVVAPRDKVRKPETVDLMSGASDITWGKPDSAEPSNAPLEEDIRPQSLLDSLGLRPTDTDELIRELGFDEPLVFPGSTRDSRVREDNASSSQAKLDINGLEDLLGRPAREDGDRLPQLKTQTVVIEDDPRDPENIGALDLWDLPLNWIQEIGISETDKQTPTALGKKLVTHFNATLNKLQKNLEPELMPGAREKQSIDFELFENMDLSDPLALKFIAEKAVLVAKNLMAQASDKFQPILAENAELALGLDELVPLTETQIRTNKLRLAHQAAALFVAISLIGQGSPLDNREKTHKTTPLRPSAASIVNVDGTINLQAMAEEVKRILALAPSTITPDQIAAQVIAPQEKAEKLFIQKRGVLEYPTNLVEKDGGKLAQLPENERLYRFFTLQDYGEFGVGQGETCPAQRWAQKDTIGVIHTGALAWNALHPEIRLMIADLNADGHASHKQSIDFDVYVDDDSIRIGSAKYKKEHAIELGKIYLNTNKVSLMFFNDPEVITELNQYAKDKGLSGEVEYAKNHDAHFHVRINNEPGPFSAPSCEDSKPEPKIGIAWMPQDVMRWEPQIIKYSKEFKVDPDLVAILLYKENRGKTLPDSPTGAIGPMYVQPETAVGIAKKLGIENYNLRDIETNFKFGIAYLSEQLETFGKPEDGPSWDRTVLKVAMAYNGGPGAVEGYLKGEVLPNKGPFCESREYSRWVLDMWRERNDKTSKTREDYDRIGHRCSTNPNVYPIPSLR